jgi:hypothetical protein
MSEKACELCGCVGWHGCMGPQHINDCRWLDGADCTCDFEARLTRHAALFSDRERMIAFWQREAEERRVIRGLGKKSVDGIVHVNSREGFASVNSADGVIRAALPARHG